MAHYVLKFNCLIELFFERKRKGRGMHERRITTRALLLVQTLSVIRKSLATTKK